MASYVERVLNDQPTYATVNGPTFAEVFTGMEGWWGEGGWGIIDDKCVLSHDRGKVTYGLPAGTPIIVYNTQCLDRGEQPHYDLRTLSQDFELDEDTEVMTMNVHSEEEGFPPSECVHVPFDLEDDWLKSDTKVTMSHALKCHDEVLLLSYDSDLAGDTSVENPIMAMSAAQAKRGRKRGQEGEPAKNIKWVESEFKVDYIARNVVKRDLQDSNGSEYSMTFIDYKAVCKSTSGVKDVFVYIDVKTAQGLCQKYAQKQRVGSSGVKKTRTTGETLHHMLMFNCTFFCRYCKCISE